MQEAPLFDDSAPLYAPIVPMTPDAELRRLGERLPRGIYLGSSSWNFKFGDGIGGTGPYGLRRLSRFSYGRH